jgi:HD superfamily phosphohydrolase YqeK
MDNSTLEQLKHWFQSYVEGFKDGDADTLHNVMLKEEHTRLVCQDIVGIGRDLGLQDQDLLLAEVCGLFHDVARFEQYLRYRTFLDRDSVNHAEFAVEILRKHSVLHRLGAEEEDLVLRAISYHNRPSLPEEEIERCLLHAMLLRDADKLDIYRVAADYYHQKPGERNEAIGFDLPDTPGFSEDIRQALIEGRLQARGHLERIKDALPASEQVEGFFAEVQSNIRNRIAGSSV